MSRFPRAYRPDQMFSQMGPWEQHHGWDLSASSRLSRLRSKSLTARRNSDNTTRQVSTLPLLGEGLTAALAC